jgi:hypothetical protein
MQHYITSTFSLTRSFLFNDPLFRFRFPLLLSPPLISIDELQQKIQKKKKMINGKNTAPFVFMKPISKKKHKTKQKDKSTRLIHQKPRKEIVFLF